MPKSDPEAPHLDDVWIDVCDPGETRRRQIEERFGVTVPQLSALAEIESSSRLRAEGAALIMTAPLLVGSNDDPLQYAPTGFILLPDTLITVHYAPLKAFEAVAQAIGTEPHRTPLSILTRLLEEVVDRAADQLESVSDLTASVSHTIFYANTEHSGLKTETGVLRRSIIELGRASDRASRARYMFLSIGRMAKFVDDRCESEMDEKTRARLRAIAHDIDSLDEFEISLSGRIQFLLDAATSLISIRQNDVVKVLTVASVVGIPPVLVVGVYGMNFHVMPELSWPWGYPFSLGLCLFSAVVPYLWFKWRKWV